MSILIPNLLPYVATGLTGDQGHSALRPDHDWEWLLNGVDDPRSPASLFRKHGGAWLHNPGGRYLPMSFDQWAMTRGHALADPGNVLLQNSADIDAFIIAASKFKSEGLWLCCYTGGGERTLTPTANESSEEWANRALVALDPILQISPIIDAIGFDATMGRTVKNYSQAMFQGSTKFKGLEITGGETGGVAILNRNLQNLGIDIYCEAGILKSAHWMRTCSVICRDRFKVLKEKRGLWIRDENGEEDPLFDPVHDLSDKPIVLLKDSEKKTNEEKLEDIAEINAQGWVGLFTSYRMPT